MKKISKENKELLLILGGVSALFVMANSIKKYGGAGDVAANLVRKWEGYEPIAKDDGFGNITGGYGTVTYPDGSPVQDGDQHSRAEWESYMWNELSVKLAAIQSNIKIEANDNIIGALASFAYNEGLTALFDSTLWAQLNAGVALPVVAKQFERWVYVDGVPVEGLKNRRLDEEKTFLT